MKSLRKNERYQMRMKFERALKINNIQYTQSHGTYRINTVDSDPIGERRDMFFVDIDKLQRIGVWNLLTEFLELLGKTPQGYTKRFINNKKGN